MKLLTCFLLLFTLSKSPDLSSVRKNYISAATSEQDVAAFCKMFEGIADDYTNTTIIAYKAISIVLKARYEKGIFAKTKLFNKGTGLLDEVILREPDNYEARLLRLNIQEHVPWITGYTSEIDEDKAFLIKNYNAQEQSLRAFARNYIMQSGEFTTAEKKLFN